MRHKYNASIFDYFFVLRPTLFFPIWTVFLAGYFVHAHELSGTASDILSIPINRLMLQSRPFFICSALTLLLGGAFIINQIADIETDRQNKKLFLIANECIPIKHAIGEACLLVALSVVVALVYSLIQGILFVVIFMVSGIFYSVKPFVWKNRPLLGLAVNAFAGIIIFAIGWDVYKSEALQSGVWHSIPYMLAILSVYFCTTLPDIKGDESTGKITFGVKYGVKTTTYCALFADSGSILFSILLKDWLVFFPALISLPLFIRAAVTLQMKDIFRAIKFPIFFLSIAVCWKWPPYFLLVLLIFLFSRWYYCKRFNLNYPSFSE